MSEHSLLTIAKEMEDLADVSATMAGSVPIVVPVAELRSWAAAMRRTVRELACARSMLTPNQVKRTRDVRIGQKQED